MKKKLDLTYPAILTILNRYVVPGRTESRAFLSWFLENFYRLADTDAQDCVCDGPDDKGIDAVYIQETTGQVDVFQSKLFQNKSKTVGDTALREFIGSFGSWCNILSVN